MNDVTVVATHVRPAQGYGGVAESVYTLCSAWANKGRAFRLCVSDGSTRGRVTTAGIGLPPSVPVDLYRAMMFKRWGFGPGAICRVLRSCLAGRCIYVCGIATWPTTLAAILCTILGRPFVVATRGGLMARPFALIKSEKPLKWLFYRHLTLPTLRAAAAIHVTSELERQDVHAILPRARCVTVPNGLDLAQWTVAPAVRQVGLTLCYVGRISREKGINLLLRAWLATRLHGERFIVVGDGHGAYAEQFRDLVSQADGAIEVTGYLPRHDISGVLARSDFLVLPSGLEDDDVRENFGNVVAESLASGRPALVSAGLAWDFLESEGLGMLLDKSNIADVIARARSMPADAYAHMCRMARHYAETNLDIEVAADKLWSIMMTASASD